MRSAAANNAHAPQAGRLHLDAAWSYLQAVESLATALAAAAPTSRAMRALLSYTVDLTASERFCDLRSDCTRLRQSLASVRYSVHVRGARVTVASLDDEPDYCVEVRRTFERFGQGVTRDYRVPIADRERLDHVEARVLDGVAALFASEFDELGLFCTKWQDFVDPVVDRFRREVRFYLAYLSFTGPLRTAGLPMCYPEVRWRPEESWARDSYDLALARKLVLGGGAVVTNDFSLGARETLLVVSGANQGGKTTFARMFGQLHHLAALGCPVPGTGARIRLCDEIFTHFPREESPGSTGGRLEDDLRCIREILLTASPDSVLVVNELFTSTTRQDASFLGRKFVERVCEIGLIGVCVTFLEELTTMTASTVSMVSTVDPEDPSTRTFRVLRRPADGRSSTAELVRRHGLGSEQLAARLLR